MREAPARLAQAQHKAAAVVRRRGPRGKGSSLIPNGRFFGGLARDLFFPRRSTRRGGMGALSESEEKLALAREIVEV